MYLHTYFCTLQEDILNIVQHERKRRRELESRVSKYCWCLTRISLLNLTVICTRVKIFLLSTFDTLQMNYCYSRSKKIESKIIGKRRKHGRYHGKSHKFCFRLKCSAISVCNWDQGGSYLGRRRWFLTFGCLNLFLFELFLSFICLRHFLF